MSRPDLTLAALIVVVMGLGGTLLQTGGVACTPAQGKTFLHEHITTSIGSEHDPALCHTTTSYLLEIDPAGIA